MDLYFSAPVHPPESAWTCVLFYPDVSSGDDAFTPGRGVKFDAPAAARHLRTLRSRLANWLKDGGYVASNRAQQVYHSCPRIEAPNTSNELITLGIRQSRSWELAYMLACLCAADLGVWGSERYWATGVFDRESGKFKAEGLDQKFRYVLNQPGNHTFLAPQKVPKAQLPPDKHVIEVRKIADLFTRTASPLRGNTTFHYRYSSHGTPDWLREVADRAPTYQTRAPVAAQLAEELSDKENGHVVVSAGSGWGKTTFIAKGCDGYQDSVLAIDCSQVETAAEVAERVLDSAGIRAPIDGECINRRVANLLAAYGLESTLLVFCNGHQNLSQRISPTVWEFIVSLRGRGFRCVTEIDSSEDLNWSTSSADLRTFSHSDIPRLCIEEVEKLAKKAGCKDAEIIDTLSMLEGHPALILQVLAQMKKERDLGLSVDANAVYNWSVQAAQRRNSRGNTAQEAGFSEAVKLWFALFGSSALPRRLIAANDKRALRRGVYCGHVQVRDGRFSALGILRLQCVRELLEGGLDCTQIPFRWSELEDSSAARDARLYRQIMFLASRCDDAAIRDRLQAFADEMPSEPLTEFEYLAPLEREGARRLSREVLEPSARSVRAPAKRQLWLLGQAARQDLSAETEELWNELIDTVQVTETLNKNWVNLQPLKAAHETLEQQIGPSPSRNRQLLDQLENIQPADSGGKEEVAVSLLAQAARLDAHESSYLRRRSIDRAEQLLEQSNREQHDASNSLRAQHYLAKAHYSDSSSATEAIAHLDLALEACRHALNAESIDPAWERRFLSIVSEKVALSDPADAEELLADALDLVELSQTTISSLNKFVDRVRHDNQMAQPVQRAVERWAKAWWRLARRDWTSNSDMTALMCGILAGEQRARRASCSLLKDFWDAPAEVNHRPELVDFTSFYLEYARRNPLWGRREFGDIRQLLYREKIVQAALTDLPPRRARRFWLARLREETQRFLDRSNRNTFSLRKHRDRIRALCREALDWLQPSDAIHVFALRFEVEAKLWRLLAKGRRPFETKLPDKMVEMFPTEPVAWRVRAKYKAFIWKTMEALESAKRYYELSSHATDKRNALEQRFEILVVQLYTPKQLHTPYSFNELTSKHVEQLKTVVKELIAMWPHRHYQLRIFSEAQAYDQTRWVQVLDELEQRLPKPDLFWTALSSNAHDEQARSAALAAIADLTAANLIRLVAFPLRHAAGDESLPEKLRRRLSEVAVRCVFSAILWRRGQGKDPGPRLKFDLGVSLLLALDLGQQELFGRELSPMQSNSGRHMEWSTLASSCLQSARSKAVGSFASHTDAIMKRWGVSD